MRSARRPCTWPGCPELLSSGSRCVKHAVAWQRAKPTKRITGRRLQAMREQLFRLHPVCQACHRKLSSQRDHIVPLEEGGADDDSNTQALCDDCHAAKSQAEALRGRLKYRGGG